MQEKRKKSLVKPRATCNVLQKLPKLRARVVYHSKKAGVKTIQHMLWCLYFVAFTL